jgi:multidrug efflux system membrane fusion protein
LTDQPDDEPRRWSRRRSLLLTILGLVVVALLVWRCSGSSGGSKRGGARPPATVGTAKAVASDMPVTLSAIGTVQPIVAATVRTQLAGVLFSLDFREGQVVRKGQKVAQIDPRPYQLALTQAQGTLARDQAQLNDARLILSRYRTLLAQDSIARQQVDTQAATVHQLEGTVEADQAAVGAARLNLNYTSISAPVSGRVGLRQADIGNYVTPSDANGIVVITQTDPIDVSFALPQDQFPKVQQRLSQSGSMPVTAMDQAGTSVLAKGRFLTFDNQIDATTGTVKAKARFANGDGRLFPNQFVNVSLLVDTLSRVVTVPVTAVRHGAQGDFVFLLMPNRTAKLSVVKTGPSLGSKIAILSGVKLGDTVITEGADRVDDGSKVSLPGDRRGPGGQGGRWRGGKGGDGNGGGGQGRHRRRESGGGDAP